jgi:hypothetical protein
MVSIYPFLFPFRVWTSIKSLLEPHFLKRPRERTYTSLWRKKGVAARERERSLSALLCTARDYVSQPQLWCIHYGRTAYGIDKSNLSAARLCVCVCVCVCKWLNHSCCRFVPAVIISVVLHSEWQQRRLLQTTNWIHLQPDAAQINWRTKDISLAKCGQVLSCAAFFAMLSAQS